MSDQFKPGTPVMFKSESHGDDEWGSASVVRRMNGLDGGEGYTLMRASGGSCWRPAACIRPRSSEPCCVEPRPERHAKVRHYRYLRNYKIKSHADGFNVYRIRHEGEAEIERLIATYADFVDARNHIHELAADDRRSSLASDVIRKAATCENPERLQAALDLLNGGPEDVEGVSRILEFALPYGGNRRPVIGPFRSVNARIDPVPAGALAALDDHLDVLDEEVA